MSTQRTKTKRLGSHRRVTKQNETPKADELHVMDSTSVAQSHIAEKNSESLSVSFNCDSMQLEGPYPPSPDLIVNRKKLGSRRKKKEQLVKDSATESHREPREEVEENTKGNETQSERQEELSKGTGQDVTATHDSSVHSVITPGYSCEAKRPTTTSSEDVLENIIPQDQNTDQNVNETDCEVKSDCCKLEETMLEVTDKSGIVQSKEVKTSAHLVGSSDSVLLSLTINQQLMDQSDYREVLKEPVSGYSATEENESFETTEMSLLTDTTVQVTSVTGMDKSESHQTEELGQIEEIAHHEDISELHGSPLHPALSDGQQLINQTNIKVRKEREDNRDFLRQWEMLQANSSVNESSVVSDDVSVNQPTEIQEIHLTDDHSQSEINDATEIQFANLTDQTELCDAELYHIPKQEGAEDITGNDPLQKMALTLQTTNQEEESQESELTSDFFSEVQNPSTTTSLEADLKSLIQKRGDPEESNDEREAGFKVEMYDGAMESDTLQSEKITDIHSEVPVDEVHEQEVKPTQIQTMHASDYSFKNATHDTAEKSDTCSGNLKDQDEVSGTHQPELLVEDIDDPAPKEDVSDPGDKQNKHPTKERNVVDSDQINEDDLVFDMKKQQTNDIERADIAPGQGHESDGRVEDDVKPSAEQTSHREKEGLGSEVEESETSLQTLQSGSNAPSDSQPQDNSVEADDKSDTDVKPIGNRRKMGSSRRNKGRQPGKISGADAYSRPAEEDAGDVHDLEDLQTTSLAVQTISQDNSENDIIMSVSHDRSLNTESLSDYSSEVQNSSTTTSLEAEMESFIPKGRDPEESHDEREAAFKVEMSNEAVEGELEERMDKSDTLQYLSDTHSEVPVDEVHEQEVKPTQIQTMHESDYSFKNAMHDPAEKSDTCSGNLKDQDEVSGTHQPELLVENIDDPAPKEEVSDPGDKQNKHPTKERNVVDSDQINEDDLVFDMKKQQTNDIERADIAPGQGHESDGRVEDDVKPSAEQTSHREKEGLGSEVEESETSLQTLQSGSNAPSDLQPQDNSVEADDKSDTDVKPIGNRRKMGSSRRNKGRQPGKISGADAYSRPAEEDAGDVHDLEDLQTTSLAVQTISQDNSENDIIMSLSHDRSLNTESLSDYSSEVQNSSTTTSLEAEMESFIPKGRDPEESHDEREAAFKVEMSNEVVEGELEERMDKSDTLQYLSDTHSEVPVDEVHEQEVKPTQIQTMHASDYSFKNATHDTAEKSDTCSGNLTDQDEVSGTHQPELLVENIDDPAPKEDVSDPGDKQNKHPTKERNVVDSDQINEDDLVFDMKKQQTNDIERADIAPGQGHESDGRVEDDVKPSAEQTSHREKEGLGSEVEESEISLQTLQSGSNAPSDSQPQDNSVEADEKSDTDVKPIGNRRKMGSSRRNKGRQPGKISGADAYSRPAEEDAGDVHDLEDLQTTSLAVQTISQDNSENDIIMSVSHDRSLNTESLSDYSSEAQNSSTTTSLEAEMESFIPKGRDPEESHDEREAAFKVEMSNEAVEGELEERMDKSDTLQYLSDTHSEVPVDEVHEQEVKPTQIQTMHASDYSFKNATHDTAEKSDTCSGNLKDQDEVSGTHQPELLVEDIDDPAPKEDVSDPGDKQNKHPTKERNVVDSDQINEDDLVFDMKKQQTNDIERADIAPGQGHESDGRVEDDVKPSAEQTSHREKEGLGSEVEESEISLQTLQSGSNAPSDSQPQDNSVEADDKSDTDVKPIGNRRKMGSSRRNKGRQPGKISGADAYSRPAEEDAGDVHDLEDLQTTSLAVQTISQDNSENDIIMSVSHDRSLNTESLSDYSSEVQNSSTTTSLEAEMESFIPKGRDPEESHDEREAAFKVKMSDEAVEGELEERMDKSDTLQYLSDTHSEVPVDEVHEQEVKPTQIQTMHASDYSFKNATHDTAEKSDTCSGNLKDQDEVSGTHQPELLVEDIDDPAPKEDVSDPGDKQNKHPTKERNVVDSDQINEDDLVFDMKKQQTNDIERADIAPGQGHESDGRVEDDVKPSAEQTSHREKEGLGSEVEESEISLQTLQSGSNAPSDSQPQDNSVEADDKSDTDVKPIGNRRKMGSSRRNKGRQPGKISGADAYSRPAEEDAGDVHDLEDLQTTSLAVQTISQDNSENDIIMSVSHDRSLNTESLSDYSSEVQNSSTTTSLEAEMESFIPKGRDPEESHDEREAAFKVKMSDEAVEGELEERMDKSDTLQYLSDTHSEVPVDEVHEQEVKPTQIQTMHASDYSFKNATHDTAEKSDTCSGNLKDQDEVSGTHQPELLVDDIDDPAPKEDVSDPGDKQNKHPTKERNVVDSDQINEDDLVFDMKKQQTNDIERADIAPGQGHESDGRVEDDVKPSAEQTSHREKEGLGSEVEESEISLQTLQSGSNAPSDSQPQDNSVEADEKSDTDVKPIGNRRKMGSSRRNKGRQPGKISGADAYSRPAEEDAGDVHDLEDLQTTSLAVQTISQDNSENDIIMSVSHDRSLNTESLSDYSSEAQNSSTTTSLEAEMESFIPKGRDPEESHDEREAAFKVEMSNEAVEGELEERMDKSDTLQYLSDTHSEVPVDEVHEQEVKPTQIQTMHASDYSFKNATHDTAEKSDTCSGNLKDQDEVSGTHQPELLVDDIDDPAPKEDVSDPGDKQNKHPTKERNVVDSDQINEDDLVFDMKKQQTNDIERADIAPGQGHESDGRVEDDVKPSAEQTSHWEKEGLGSEVEESEISLQTLQSGSNAPSDSQPQDNSVEADEKSDTDVKPIGNRRKMGSSRRNKGRQPGKISGADAYSRPAEEDAGDVHDLEDLQTTSLAVQTISQDNSENDIIMSVSHDRSLNTESLSDYSSEAQNSSTTTSLEAEMESFIPKGRDPEESHDEREAAFKVEMSNEAVEGELEERMDKSDTLQYLSDTHSEVPVDEVHEQEVKPTQIQTMHASDYSFKNATHDTAEKSDTCSGNLKDQDEVSGTHQPELLVEDIDDPAPKEDVSDPGDKQNKHPTKERNVVDSDQINEDDLVFDMKKQQTNDIERADIAPGQGHESDGRVEDDVKPSAEQTSHREKEGLGSEVEESEISLQTLQSGSNAPSDSQPQDNSVEADDKSDTDVKPIGNRRKMGSSRRNKGRQPGKISGADAYSRPAEEDAGDVHDLEDLQTTSLAVQTISQDNSENDIIMSVSHDRSLNTESLSDYSSEVQNSSTTTSLEAEMESFIPKGRDPEESHDEREAAFKVKMSDEAVEGELEERMDKSDTLQYLSDTHSEVPVDEVHEQEVKPTQIQTMHASDYSFENATHDTAEKSDTCSGNLKDQDEVVQTEEVTDQIKEIAHVGISELTHPNLCTSSTVDQQVIDQSNARDMPADNLPSVSPLTDRTINKESEQDTDLLRQWGILQAIKMVSESNLKSDGIDSSDTTEKTAENSSPRQHIEAEFSVEQATVSSAKEELSTNEEQNERFSLSEVRFDQPSEDAVHEEEEANLPEIKTMHQFDDSPAKSQSTKQETPQGFKSTGNRRKLGSSRRHKGRQHVPGSVTEPSTRLKEAVENTWDDELCEVEKIPPGTVTTRQEERKEEENMQGEDTTSQNLMDSSATVTTGIPSRLDENIFFKSTEEVSQEEEKHTKKPEDLSLLTIYDTVKTDLLQSEEASAGRSVDAQGPRQVEIREECEDTANTESRAPFDIEQHLRANPAVEMSEVSGISKATDTWNSQQDKQEGTPVDNSENLQVKGQRKKRKMGSTRRPLLDRKQDGEIDNKVETIESNSDVEVDVRSLDTVEGLPLIGTTEASQGVNAQRLLRTGHEEQKTNETASQRQMPQSSTSDLQTVESNMKPGIDESMVLFSKQSASYSEEAVNPVALVHATDIRDHEGNIEVSVEPQQLDDFTSTEMQTNSVVTKRNRHSINQHLSSNTQDATSTESGVAFSSSETAQSKLHDKQSPESIKVKQDQALKPTEAVSVGLADLEKAKSGFREGAEEELAQASEQEPSNGNTEDQTFGVTSRRRKLGSTRKNLGSRSNGRDLHQKQEVTNEATAIIVEDALTEGISRIKEKVVQVHTDSEQRKDRVLEAVECSHTGKSLLKPMAHQTVEEKPDSPIQLGETELQITPDYLQSTPSTFQKHDVSESAGGGKRRKMGSHRKSRGHQHLEDQSVREDRTIDAEMVRDVTSITAEEHTTPWGMDKILEVGDGKQEASSNISGRASNRVNPFQCPQAEFQFGQQSQKKVSFAEGDIRSKSYNVLMVGESSVGKTSFMKRAQSGKFSLDLPASVGLDSCMWTVVVDGKPVVLKIWDTAGQERFHSITRQIFHKAQAFLLMYDITSTQSFSAISYWANSIQEGAAEDVSILLLGNKCDCAKRKVKTQEGEILAKEYNYEFMECSAATGENVIQSLETVARMLSQKVDTTEEELVLHKEPPQKKRSGCC